MEKLCFSVSLFPHLRRWDFNWILRKNLSRWITFPFFRYDSTPIFTCLSFLGKAILVHKSVKGKLGQNGVFHLTLFRLLLAVYISFSCLPTECSSYSSNTHSFPTGNDSPVDFTSYCNRKSESAWSSKSCKLRLHTYIEDNRLVTSSCF